MSYIKIVLGIVIVVLMYLLLTNILGFGVKSLIADVNNFIKKVIKKSSNTLEKRNFKRFETQSRKEKQKSLYYNFYKLVSNIVADLELKSMTPDYLIVLVFVGSATFSVICNFVGMSVFTDLLMFLCCFIGVFCILYLKSRSRSRLRREAIRDAEDLICQNIELSVLNTIRKVMPDINPIIRPAFDRFIINQKTVFIIKSLEILNDEIGSQFDNLVGKLIKLEKEGKPGMLDAFKSNINRNSIQREYELEEKIREDQDAQECLICLATVIVTYFGTFFGFNEIRKFYCSVAGQIITLTCVLVILGIFCYCQWVQSKEYEEMDI